jgi:hypothetical protein
MENLEQINQRLIDHFGLFEDGQPNWRIVWSDDQREMRYGTYPKYSEHGIYLGEYTGVLEVPKYSQWITHKWVLERIFPVPAMNSKELITKLSYEPVWVFEDGKGQSLPYKWEVAKLVIDSIYEEGARVAGVKQYHDPDQIPEEAIENEKKRLEALQSELFGNETEVGDALAHHQGVTVPSNYEANVRVNSVEPRNVTRTMKG